MLPRYHGFSDSVLLAHHDININGKANNGWFPLQLAALYGLTSIVVKLGMMPSLRGVNDQGGCGRTPLSWATQFGEDKQATVGKDQVILLVFRITLSNQLKASPNGEKFQK